MALQISAQGTGRTKCLCGRLVIRGIKRASFLTRENFLRRIRYVGARVMDERARWCVRVKMREELGVEAAIARGGGLESREFYIYVQSSELRRLFFIVVFTSFTV